MEERNHIIIENLFKCWGLGFVVLCFRVPTDYDDAIKIIKFLYTAFWFSFILIIPVGFAWMLMMEIYFAIKKNSNQFLSYE